jgi:hypothetical protein
VNGAIKWEWGTILLSGQQSEFQAGHIETSPDAGTPFRRERFTDIGEILQGQIILSQNDADLFKYWYKSDLRQGTINFSYYDCNLEVERIGRIIDKPTYSFVSNRVQINFQMMFIPMDINIQKILCLNDMSPILLEDQTYIYNDGLIYL